MNIAFSQHTPGIMMQVRLGGGENISESPKPLEVEERKLRKTRFSVLIWEVLCLITPQAGPLIFTVCVDYCRQQGTVLWPDRSKVGTDSTPIKLENRKCPKMPESFMRSFYYKSLQIISERYRLKWICTLQFHFYLNNDKKMYQS